MPSSPLEKSFTLKRPLYKIHEAIREAERCLYCYDAPCIKACPTEINIPRFIGSIAEQKPINAARIIFEENIMGYSCSKVCPVEVLCEGACVLNHEEKTPIAIGRLQHFATHEALTKNISPKELLKTKDRTHKRVACVGAGPASLTVASLLALNGHSVEIFEGGVLGGLNAWGIAPYKFHYDDALFEIEWLKQLGIIFHENCPLTIDESSKGIRPIALETEFDAIFLGMGIGDDLLLNELPKHDKIMGATAFVKKLKTDASFAVEGINHAHIIGGGNTALDVAQELALLKIPHVTLVYRKSKHAMSAYDHEKKDALSQGVAILEHTVLDQVSLPNTLREPLTLSFQQTGHSSPKTITESSDLLILAIGQDRNLRVAENFKGLVFEKNGCIQVDKTTFRTAHHKIWAAGDCVNGGKEVVNAVAEAKFVAKNIDDYLMNQVFGEKNG